MATLVDGMGFEELGDVGDPGSKVAQLWVTGSIVTQSNIQAAGTGSFAGNLQAATLGVSAAAIVGTATNSNGLLESIFYESGTTAKTTSGYGAAIQIGNLTTSAGSAATVTFINAFTAGSYAILFSIVGATAQGSINAYTSGTLRASGCEVIGAPSEGYNWVAFGI